MLKNRLLQLLAKTPSIDYNAKLVKKDRKVILADPELASKDPFWKACFCSGKHTVVAARAFAQQWLTEMKQVAGK